MEEFEEKKHPGLVVDFKHNIKFFEERFVHGKTHKQRRDGDHEE